jgi:hypothetical protein
MVPDTTIASSIHTKAFLARESQSKQVTVQGYSKNKLALTVRKKIPCFREHDEHAHQVWRGYAHKGCAMSMPGPKDYSCTLKKRFGKTAEAWWTCLTVPNLHASECAATLTQEDKKTP